MAKPSFDMIVLKFGYKRYVMPKAAAMQFMEACAGHDIYELDNHWSSGNDHEEHAWPLRVEEMPGVSLIGPAQFHQALENRKMYIERQRAEKAAKEANAQ